MRGSGEMQMNKALQLLQARKESLDQIHGKGMQPLGKLFGADTFLWVDPEMPALAHTFMSFPYPIVWLAQVMEYRHVHAHIRHQHPDFLKVLLYGNSEGEVFTEEEVLRDKVHFVADFEEASSLLASWLHSEITCLVTASNAIKEEVQSTLEQLKTGK